MSDFETLLRKHLDILERFVKYRISRTEDAEDIIQETCLTAFGKYDSLKNKSAFKAWLLTVAKNKCVDYYRAKSGSGFISIDELPESALSSGRCGLTVKNTVVETMDRLNARDRQILKLYYIDELRQDEISEKLDIPLGTVKSRLHYAKENFRKNYPYKYNTGENIMKKFPDIMPEYKITPSSDSAFPVVFEELPNWFIIPKMNEEASSASYDYPARKKTEEMTSRVLSKAVIHDIEGVEIVTSFKNSGSEYAEPNPDHTYYAQLTDTHCRWLGESYIDKNGARRILTFLDGDDFTSEWGYGENNCGYETHISPRGLVTRDGNAVSVSSDGNIFDSVGRYTVEILGKSYDTVCIIEHFTNGALSEKYVDRNGRTILWRRFNRDDWAISRYGRTWSEIHPENEKLTVNGTTYVHWYDCITDYIL